MPPTPFFPDPLDDFEPKKPDFEPEIDPDYDDLESNCSVCQNKIRIHTTRELVVCALTELRGGITN